MTKNVHVHVHSWKINIKHTQQFIEDKFKDTKGVIRSRKSKKNRQFKGKKKKNKGTPMINIAQYRQVKIEQHDLPKNRG